MAPRGGKASRPQKNLRFDDEGPSTSQRERTRDLSSDSQNNAEPPAKRAKSRSKSRQRTKSPAQPSVLDRVKSGQIKGFCWVCHKEWRKTDPSCKYCSRVFHSDCLKREYNLTSVERCPVCRMEHVDGSEYKPTIIRTKLAANLRLMFEHLNKTIGKHMRDLKAFDCPLFKDHQYLRTLDLTILEDRLYQKIPLFYKSTGHFFSDVCMIYHNCVVFGQNPKLEKQARMFRKSCEEELIDIEACPECYLKSHTSDKAFTEPCFEPHPIVWAKMRSYPHWPAKVLKIIDGKASIRFFGRHQKYRIAVKNCLEMSLKSPAVVPRDRYGYGDACEELARYIQKYRVKYGEFPYAPVNTPFKADKLLRKYALKKIQTVSSGHSETGSGRHNTKRTEGQDHDHTICLTDESEDELSIIGEIRRPALMPALESEGGNRYSNEPSTSTASLSVNHVELDFCVERDPVSLCPTVPPSLEAGIETRFDTDVATNSGVDMSQGAISSVPMTPNLSVLPNDYPLLVQQVDPLCALGFDIPLLMGTMPQESTGQSFNLADLKQSTRNIVANIFNTPMFGLPVFDRHCQKIMAYIVSGMQQMLVDVCTGTSEQHNQFRKMIDQLKANDTASLENVINKQDFDCILKRLNNKYTGKKRKLLTQVEAEQEKAKMFSEKCEAIEKELAAVKETEQRRNEELQAQLQVQKAELEQRMQEKIGDMEKRYHELEQHNANFKAKLEQSEMDKAAQQCMLMEYEKVNEVLKSCLEKSKQDAVACKNMIYSCSESIEVNKYKPLVERLNSEVARVAGLEVRVNHLQTAARKTNALAVGGETVSCEAEGTVHLRFRHKKEWNVKHATAVPEAATRDWVGTTGQQKTLRKRKVRSKIQPSTETSKTSKPA